MPTTSIKNGSKNARPLEQPKGGMCKHIVNVCDAQEVDSELIAWIKSAFEGAGYSMKMRYGMKIQPAARWRLWYILHIISARFVRRCVY